MPRRPRLIVTGVPHHVTQRGNDRQQVFFQDADRRFYLCTLRERAVRHGLEILGYCLMTNHVHLVVLPERDEALAWTLGPTHSLHAQMVNSAVQRCGHLWQNRFFSCPLEGGRVWDALRYSELNPVRAGLVEAAWDWPWSSARAHAGMVNRDPLLEWEWEDWPARWDREWWRQVLASEMDAEACQEVRACTWRGEPLGSEGFVAELERAKGRRLRVLARGRPRKREPEAPGGRAAGRQLGLFTEAGSAGRG